MKGNRNYAFDMTVIYKGESIRVTGEITPGYPERGPSYDCGGTPAEPPEIEEYRIFDEDGKEVEDPDGTIIDEIYDQVMMKASEDYDEGPDPDEARDRALERELSGRGEYDD